MIASGFRPSVMTTAAFGIELDHHVGPSVDDPDVVLGIDAHRCARRGSRRCPADLADVLAGPVELEQARAAVRERARGAERRVRIAGSRVDEDVPLRVRRDAGRFAQVDVVGQLQQIGAES